MIQHYSGEIGEFDYDDSIFELRKIEDKDTGYDTDRLFYIKPEGDGPINGWRIHIPKGIKNCKEMFINCTMLQDFPEIPEGVENCDWMFSGCLYAKGIPKIPDSVKNCNYMFNKCMSMEELPKLPDNVINYEGVFTYCNPMLLKELYQKNNKEQFVDEDGVIIDDDYDEELAEVEDLILDDAREIEDEYDLDLDDMFY